MKVRLIIVPPGGGEADYSFHIEMPAVPASGDYITVRTEGEVGVVSLLVKRTWWALLNVETRMQVTSGDERWGSTEEVSVECYPAQGLGFDSESHKRTLDMYDARGKKPPVFDSSMY